MMNGLNLSVLYILTETSFATVPLAVIFMAQGKGHNQDYWEVGGGYIPAKGM